MKFVHSFALIFACLVAATIFFVPAPVEPKKLKKKTLIPLLLGVLLASKEKFKPLPLPIPIPLPIKDEKVIPYPEPYHYPVYVDGYPGPGYGHGGGGGGHGGDYAAAASGHMPQYAPPPAQYAPQAPRPY